MWPQHEAPAGGYPGLALGLLGATACSHGTARPVPAAPGKALWSWTTAGPGGQSPLSNPVNRGPGRASHPQGLF